MGLIDILNSIGKTRKKVEKDFPTIKQVIEKELAQGLPKSGIDLIKRFEGCHLVAYRDPKTGGKPYTIGWGNTRDIDGKEFKLGERITQEYADKLFEHVAYKKLEVLRKTIPYWSAMNEQMRGALLSFAYNLGSGFYNSRGFSTISKVLRDKEWSRLPTVIYLYRNPGTNVEAGLARRRLAEGILWQAGLDKLERSCYN
jgi:GH24 family phage-related lysozyme (muramidase)